MHPAMFFIEWNNGEHSVLNYGGKMSMKTDSYFAGINITLILKL